MRNNPHTIIGLFFENEQQRTTSKVGSYKRDNSFLQHRSARLLGKTMESCWGEGIAISDPPYAEMQIDSGSWKPQEGVDWKVNMTKGPWDGNSLYRATRGLINFLNFDLKKNSHRRNQILIQMRRREMIPSILFLAGENWLGGKRTLLIFLRRCVPILVRIEFIW